MSGFKKISIVIMNCKVCYSEMENLFKSLVLNKYKVSYFKCPNCDFIQTEKPFWLDESYNNAITDLDVGLVSRNLNYSNLVEKIIKLNFNEHGKFLDYAGGYGLFVRLMRDKGFNFYREDKYCENIFAQNHDLENLNASSRFELVTAFEVFEHLENPLREIEKMLDYSDVLLFSTELQPDVVINNAADWWYFTPETGQHIAFYSEKTLRYIAEKLHCTFYTNGDLHLMGRKVFKHSPLLIENLDEKENRDEMISLIQSDFEFAKNIISKVDIIKKELKSQGEVKEEKEIFIQKLSVVFAQLDSTKTQLDTTKTQLDTTKTQLDNTKTQLDSTKTQLDLAIRELSGVYASREWKMILMLQKSVKIIIPKNSIRRNLAVDAWRLIKLPVKLLLKIIRKIKSTLFLCVNYFVKLRPRKKRKINKNLKKIVYVGHSYHNKTKSTAFLIDYLREFYEVEVILDESWRGNGELYPDLSFIDDSYLAVLFFQNLPNENLLKNIKNENIVFFPMYDGVGHDYDYWGGLHALKIINFSKTLHEKLIKWGFESIAVQYFPESQTFIPGKKDEVFFWQRLTKMNIDVIEKLFGDEKIEMHIHKAIDPNQEFKQPNDEQENKFKITYSDWFETREEMWDLIKQKGIYIAPRELEGIGMSFLEAMAMGKAVIAVDNPTMNEYIKHGENGYLFNLKNPKKIDLSNIEKVQKNAYNFMREGFINWGKERKHIIEFIEKA